jgi:glycosyltransferase involved in cell wall biosynthesis
LSAASRPARPFSRLLLITKKLDEVPTGGRQLLCKLNHDVLKEMYGDRFTLLELDAAPVRSLRSMVSAFNGDIDGVNRETIAEAMRLVRGHDIDTAFVDGSNLGELGKAIKSAFPRLRLSTFFHNVEAHFFLDALKHSKTPHALGVLIANYLAERKSVRFSDQIIALTTRDSRLLQRVYGRPATHIVPMALRDRLPTPPASRTPARRETFALFVGGAFYANRAGIAWFVKNVASRIQIKTFVVGTGFDAMKMAIERTGNVEVVGAVDSLAPWYLNARFVIAPIFEGSGMKTKVAEALMFGKKIIGTPDAFCGYEDIAHGIGRVCSTADEFVAAIENAEAFVRSPFDADMRALYEAKYSYGAHKARLLDILTPARSQTNAESNA